ncbi:hypothetical protein COE01_13570 [Bacillus thuringiensis]|uniref:hypothetical protein n=1 Tax=Bacillus thuringiensis TaxID=1428 RepID=UPI000BFBA661|nr:hypothetical protein [Bacillus thuringiensis]PGW84500.1 hypothetical protein COE01_13570 [Bacillus thuringiensis]
MKKILAVFFALALVFTAIGSTPAMAEGNYESDLTYENGNLRNYVYWSKELLNGPGDPNVVGYVSWQSLTVKQAWFLINTSLGPKWIGYNGYESAPAYYYDSLEAKLTLKDKKPLFNSPSNPNVVGYVANQPVTVKQAWYLVSTSLGPKWVGYNL